MTSRKLRWGILGAAAIAKRAVIPGLQQSEWNEVTAIASRDAEKGKRTADELGIARSYGSYEALLADDSIDAVYVPLPNHLHMEWTIRAAEAGKHVLCEKPFALNAAEAERMVRAAGEAGVILAEAFMYRHHPRYRQVIDTIKSGRIGKVRGIHGAFTFNSAASAGNVRFRRDWGGGSLYDVGVYPITAARLLLGSEPEAASVHAYFSPDHDDVDMMASGILEFPGGVGLTFDCGMWAAPRNTLEVLGTDGRIEIPSAFVCQADRSAHFFVTANGERSEIEVPQVNQYAAQGDDFARTVLFGDPQPFGPEDAVQNMRIVDACLLSARERARITL